MTPTEAANQMFGLGRKLTQADQDLATYVARVRTNGRRSECWRCDKPIWHDADSSIPRRWIDLKGWSWCGGSRPEPEPDPHEPKAV